MLLLHTLRYLPAQVLSPLAQLASMVLWTHWIAPVEMGVLTLVTVAQEMAFMLGLGWFSVYALRYLPSDADTATRQRYLRTENVVVLGNVGVSAAAALLCALSLDKPGLSMLDVGMIASYFATRATNQHYSERARAQSSFAAYTTLQIAGPVGGLVLGWIAMHTGAVPPTANTLLGCYALAQGVGTLLSLPAMGFALRLAAPDPGQLRAAFAFGGPLLILGVLSWVAENYIRYLVQWHSGAAALGLMIVGWSLGRRCAAVGAQLVATAAFPIAARLLNEGKREEALQHLQLNATLMMLVLLPITTAMWVLAPNLIALTVAPEYRESTAAVLGLSVVGATLRNLHVHVTDQFMVLERHIRLLAQLDVFEIAACCVLSLAGLIGWGLPGAVVGQALGSLVALGVSIALAHKRDFRWPWDTTMKILLASLAMSGILMMLPRDPSLSSLVEGSIVGTLTYATLIALIFRGELVAWRRRGIGAVKPQGSE